MKKKRRKIKNLILMIYYLLLKIELNTIKEKYLILLLMSTKIHLMLDFYLLKNLLLLPNLLLSQRILGNHDF